MAVINRAAWSRARETVHTCGGTRYVTLAPARAVWTQPKNHIGCVLTTLRGDSAFRLKAAPCIYMLGRLSSGQ